MHGNDGDESIKGGGGSDSIDGGKGNDAIHGGAVASCVSLLLGRHSVVFANGCPAETLPVTDYTRARMARALRPVPPAMRPAFSILRHDPACTGRMQRA
ncbi:hypothetical protein [Jannaschia donghaensis]|uniref:hypothetical protein n=1 Tax=Jannaschia donghaensis TaxID=420998 RepID=UPI001FDFE7D9